MIYPADDGAQGLFYEIFREVLEKEMGMKLQVDFKPWKRAQLMVASGKADFILTVATKERLTYAKKSDAPFYELYLKLYTWKGHPKLHEINQIRNVKGILKHKLIPVTNLGNGWHKENIDKFGVPTIYARADQHLPAVLASKRADIMIEAVAPMNMMIRKLSLTKKLVLTDGKFGPIQFHLLMSKKSSFLDLLPEINKVFIRLKNAGRINQILKKYQKL